MSDTPVFDRARWVEGLRRLVEAGAAVDVETAVACLYEYDRLRRVLDAVQRDNAVKRT